MKKYFYALLCLFVLSGNALQAQIFNEGFEDDTQFLFDGWTTFDYSTPLNPNFNGWYWDDASIIFPPFAGIGYVGANAASISSGNSGTISNWWFSPGITMQNGDQFSFYTRAELGIYPDRLEVRVSPAAGVALPTNATTVGSFTNVLLTINPTLAQNGYPLGWTQYTVTVSGLPAGPNVAFIGFRYFVTNGGPMGANSSSIGLDNFRYTKASCPTIAITPTSANLPSGTAGVAYSDSLDVTGFDVSGSFSISSGSLPNGITLQGNGKFVGTPTTPGTYNFTVRFTDVFNCSGQRSYTLVINCPTLTINPATLPNGTTGAAYSQTLTTSPGTGPYTYTITAGSLPSGLTLSNGVISGTPTATGTFNFTVQVTDANNCQSTRNYTLTITCGSLTLGSSLPNGTAQTPYSATVTSNGTGTVTYTVTGGNLPTGLTLNTNGSISGTPTVVGSFTFTVSATDANGCVGSQPYTVVIGCNTLTISPNSLPVAIANQLYNATLTANGASPFTFSVTAGSLPGGLTLSPNGAISGTPTAQGTFNFTVSVTDNAGCTGSLAYSLTVSCANITINPATPPAGIINQNYSQTFTASGGASPYTFSISAGSAPTGITLASNGDLAGIPTAQGTFNFTITVVDQNGCSVSFPVSQTISCPTITLAPASLANATLSSAYSETISATGGTAPYTFTLTNGSLPTGVSLDGNTGIISGTPTIAGTFNFDIAATDNSGCSGSSSYTLVVICPNVTISPSTLNNGIVGTPYTENLSMQGGTQPFNFTVSSGNIPTGVALSSSGAMSGTPTVSGSFTFVVNATDANNCSASQNYTVVIGCPAGGGVTLAPFNAVCSNATPITLTGGAPAGGTYSGAGVSNGQFNPSVGTSTITYTVLNATSGCADSAQQDITVNTAPTVTFNLGFNTYCLNDGVLTLAGGSPAGGTYSGTGVSGTSFDPSVTGAGQQTITYSFTDGNGCSAQASVVLDVQPCNSIENEGGYQVKIYPNPATSFVTITGNLDATQSYAIQIVSMDGKQVYNQAYVKGTTELSQTISVDKLTPGIYIVKIQNGTQSFNKKIVKY